MRNPNPEYIANIATSIVGKIRLDFFIEKRKLKDIRPHIVRQIFTQDVKETICGMTPETLGRICIFGKDFERDCMVVTSGTNPWSAMFLSDADSGKTLLQKVAVATLLSAINHLINDGQPHFGDTWYPIELVGEVLPSDWRKREDRIQAALGWES